MGDFSVILPNVTSYEQFKAALMKDKQLEKYLVSAIVEPMVGRSKSAKNRFNF